MFVFVAGVVEILNNIDTNGLCTVLTSFSFKFCVIFLQRQKSLGII